LLGNDFNNLGKKLTQFANIKKLFTREDFIKKKYLTSSRTIFLISKSEVMRKILFIISAAIILQLGFTKSSSGATILVSKSTILPSKIDPDPAKVKSAVEEFKNLSRHEKKMRLKEVNREVREYKKEKRHGSDDSGVSQLLLIIIAILLPPLAVALHEGGINSRFWIDLLLTLLFYLPGLIYALVIILGNDNK
jgi:uncharacterized membrane protein YqaE (UPF0057 family)